MPEGTASHPTMGVVSDRLEPREILRSAQDDVRLRMTFGLEKRSAQDGVRLRMTLWGRVELALQGQGKGEGVLQ